MALRHAWTLRYRLRYRLRYSRRYNRPRPAGGRSRAGSIKPRSFLIQVVHQLPARASVFFAVSDIASGDVLCVAGTRCKNAVDRRDTICIGILFPASEVTPWRERQGPWYEYKISFGVLRRRSGFPSNPSSSRKEEVHCVSGWTATPHRIGDHLRHHSKRKFLFYTPPTSKIEIKWRRGGEALIS